MSGDELGGLIQGLVLIAIGFFLYFFPAFVARHKRNRRAILVVNFFLGWTLLGWIGALIWAMVEKPEAAVQA